MNFLPEYSHLQDIGFATLPICMLNYSNNQAAKAINH